MQLCLHCQGEFLTGANLEKKGRLGKVRSRTSITNIIHFKQIIGRIEMG